MEELQHEVVNYKYSVSVKFKGSKKAYHFGTDEAIYNYGDKVEHDTYGIGVVIEVTNTILTIAFSKDIGIKKILKNHKSIRRV